MFHFAIRYRGLIVAPFAMVLALVPQSVQAQTACTNCVANLVVSGQTGTANVARSTTLEEPVANGHYFARVTVLTSTGANLPPGVYQAWCATSPGQGLPSSTTLVSFGANSAVNLNTVANNNLWNRINYLINHKSGTVFDVQNAIWVLRGTNNTSVAISAETAAMVAAANNNPNYVPGPGEVVGIYMDNPGTTQDILVELPNTCARLGDYVWLDSGRDGIQDAGESGIDGLTLTLKDVSGKTLATTTTGLSPLNTHGYYQFSNLCPASYQVDLDTNQSPLQGYIPALTLQGNAATDSNTIPAAVTLGSAGDDQTLDFGFMAYPAPTLACPLSTGQQGSAYSSSLIATGGFPGYTYSIVGNLPSALTLITSTGAISGTLTQYGNYSFTAKVVDSRNNEARTTTTPCSITVTPPPITLSWAGVTGQVDQSYNSSIQATGGTGSYAFAITTGSLPAGLTLNASTGAITGIPTSYGSFNFTVTVTDSSGNSALTALIQGTIVVSPKPVTLACPVGTGQLEVPYNSGLASTGGTGGNVFTITSGSLPPGLTLNTSTGSISGTPSNFGTFNITTSVTDNSGTSTGTSSVACTIVIAPKPVNLTCSASTGVVGTLYSSSLLASGGTGGYAFSISSGSLPAGLTLNALTGVITGTPATAGAFLFTVRVADSSGTSAGVKTSSCTITLAPAPVCETTYLTLSGGNSTSSRLAFSCPAPGQFATYTQGAWGSTPNGNNPGKLLAANFSTVYTSGNVDVGGTSKLTFTSASAINTFLPAGGTANKLTSSATNPSSSNAGVFAGQVLALRLNVDFSSKGITPGGLGNLKVASGALAGKTVNEVLAIANTVLGGGSLPSGLAISDLNSIVEAINNNFDGGVSDDGFLK